MAVEERVARLRALMAERGWDAVVVRRNADLRWLTGAAGVFDAEEAHTGFVTADGLWLHTDSRYYGAFAQRLGADGPWRLDMDPVGGPAWAAARAREARASRLAVEDTLTLAFAESLRRALEDASCACVTAHMHGDIARLRAVKDAGELAALRAAQAVTDAGLAHMLGYIRPGLTERELRAELDHYLLANGADGLSFDTIVASGPNTANPHAVPGPRAVEPGDLVLMDFGARVGDYCSDMTRTVAVGEPDPRLVEIYGVVLRANEECEALLRPGVRGCDVHAEAVRIISEAGYGAYFNHGLGHGVGIEIHELPRLGRSFDAEVEAGSVVTVEPGVYVPGLGGVRIEDCGVVGEGGYAPFGASTRELVRLPA